jgi:hypothetical protein
MGVRAARTDETASLRGFRSGFYGCLTGWADGLFELTDALLCAPGPVSSVRGFVCHDVVSTKPGTSGDAVAAGSARTRGDGSGGSLQCRRGRLWGA